MRYFTLLLLCTLLLGCRTRPASIAPLPPAPRSAAPPSSAPATLALSPESRPVLISQLGRGQSRIYLIAGIHGNEPEGLAVLDDLIEELRDSDLVQHATLRIAHDINPDGTAARSRGNTRAVDLNRNWPAANFRPARSRGPSPLSEPESRAIHDDLLAFNPGIVVVFHSAASGPFVNFDGPASDLAERFASAATAAGRPHGDQPWRVVPSMGYPTPGSLGSWVGIDQQIPILTIEFRRGQSPASTLRAALAGMQSLTP